MSVAGTNHRMQPYPYPEQKVNVSSKDLTNWHADPEILLEYIKEGVTEELMPIINDEWRNKLYFFIKSNYPELRFSSKCPAKARSFVTILLMLNGSPRRLTQLERLSTVSRELSNSKPNPRSCEETKKIVKEATDTLFPYRDYEMGNYRRMLDSMSDHQPATAVIRQDQLYYFLENETLHEEEDRKRQTEKAKSMGALGVDLAKSREDL
ncbi:uncharacterized protein FFMR_07022 [Fusarium fujikuroi]|nr:uncharacterized protein FFMR_07022 [Fusarium fujikuroi]SCV51907.1 uncharacterized protein FFB14_12299 [Fusarium fujikuroi]